MGSLLLREWYHGWVVILASAILGVGAAIMWVAEGVFLTRCSTKNTLGRNSGIFWGFFQACQIFGNLSAYFVFGHVPSTDYLFVIFLGLSAIGVITLLFLQKPEDLPSSTKQTSQPSKSALGSDAQNALQVPPRTLVQRIKGVCSMMFTNLPLLLLMPMFVLSGMELSFRTGEFPLIIEDTPRVGLLMTFGGIGSTIGGFMLGPLSDRIGRSLTLIVGSIMFCLALFLSWEAHEYLHSHQTLVFHLPVRACAACVMLGVCDSVFNSQLTALVGQLFPPHEMGLEINSNAFTTFQFYQHLGSFIAFFGAIPIPMHGPQATTTQAWILGSLCVISTILFVAVDLWRIRTTKDTRQSDSFEVATLQQVLSKLGQESDLETLLIRSN
eukprot:c9848_g1_i3.p1 GENE.c9848_g1_i3~~c9848_g1_i3.p1  ORF type:complete len:383 (-),score=34.93 c9848_g1_i3:229-1377(-)